MSSLDSSKEKKKGGFLNDLLFFGGLLAVMYVIRVFVMPAIGIPTCSGGSCPVPASNSVVTDQVSP